MNSAEPFHSILFDRPTRPAQREDPSLFGDLNLDQIFAAVAAGRDSYDLAPFFLIPLRDAQAVQYRHEVQRDLADEALRAAVAEFAARMRDMRKHLAQAKKLRNKYQKERWFLDAAGIYCRTVGALADALAGIELGSSGFTAFRDYLQGYIKSAAFTGLADDVDEVTGTLAAVRYCITIKGNKVRVARYEGEADYSEQVRQTFAKFAGAQAKDSAKDYRVGLREWPDMDHVEARILALAARLFPDAFAALDDFCARHAAYLDHTIRVFDREVQFYAAYADFIAPMKAAGLDFCYPAVSTDSKEVSARDTFDLALAAKLMPGATAVVRNDFHLAGPERILVVTGPNHGGKTTFARAFGQLHYLASLGYPVPASQAGLFLPDRVFTHFEREEDLATLRGKLEDELVRIREVLDQATGDSVVVMNESFASTTLRDAQFVGEQVLNRMAALGLLGVYVTFVDELASLSHACVSMVGAVVPDNPAERTYKIVRRPADGLAYAAAIAGKYGLGYAQLKERLAK
ncbi:MAG: MutS-related protein [Streptosporangiaceae bacterium]